MASAFARSSIAARTTSSRYGSPTPHAWLRRSGAAAPRRAPPGCGPRRNARSRCSRRTCARPERRRRARARPAFALSPCPRELGRRSSDGDLPHLGEGQVLARQDGGAGHSASLEAEHVLEHPRRVDAGDRSAPAARAASSDAGGTSPTSSPRRDVDASRGRLVRTRWTTSWSGARSRSMTFMRHLDAPRLRQEQADRLHAGHPAARPARTARRRRARPRRRRWRARRCTRRAARRAPTSTTPERGSIAGGPSSGSSSPDSTRRSAPSRPAAPEEGGASPVADLAVQEHRQAELLADAARRLPRAPRPRAACRPARAGRAGRRRRRRRADARPRAGAGRRARRRGAIPPAALDERVLLADEREHGPVVVGIEWTSRERDALGERLADRASTVDLAPRRRWARPRARSVPYEASWSGGRDSTDSSASENSGENIIDVGASECHARCMGDLQAEYAAIAANTVYSECAAPGGVQRCPSQSLRVSQRLRREVPDSDRVVASRRLRDRRLGSCPRLLAAAEPSDAAVARTARPLRASQNCSHVEHRPQRGPPRAERESRPGSRWHWPSGDRPGEPLATFVRLPRWYTSSIRPSPGDPRRPGAASDLGRPASDLAARPE